MFFLDDEMTNTTTLHVPVTQPPSGFYINMWGANSTWSGGMEVGMDATLDILWIEMLFNTTEPVTATGTQRVCTVETGIVAGSKQSNGVLASCPLWRMLLIAVVLAFRGDLVSC